jgi:hypothetical protein
MGEFVIIDRNEKEITLEDAEMGCRTTIELPLPDGMTEIDMAARNCARWLEAAQGRHSRWNGSLKISKLPPPFVPCPTCGKKLGDVIGNIAHGAWGVFKYFAGIDAASKEEMERRLSICAQCPSNLAQMAKGEAYCGAPLLHNVARDIAREGCGCPLQKKVAIKGEKCPASHW